MGAPWGVNERREAQNIEHQQQQHGSATAYATAVNKLLLSRRLGAYFPSDLSIDAYTRLRTTGAKGCRTLILDIQFLIILQKAVH